MTYALVTGGSRGLGRDMALKLAAEGWDVALTYLGNAAKAAEVVAEIEAMGRRAVALPLDVQAGGFEDFAAALDRALGGETLGALVNNAGIGIHASFAETTEAQFDQLMAIHLKAPFFLTQALLGQLADGASVVNISTGLARFSSPGYAAYATMKGGVEVLTRYQAKELGARGIRVNSVAPGAIETDFAGGAVRDTPQINAALAANTALGRVGLPGDIGGVVAFLCSEAGRWVTGQRLEASGGMFL